MDGFLSVSIDQQFQLDFKRKNLLPEIGLLVCWCWLPITAGEPPAANQALDDAMLIEDGFGFHENGAAAFKNWFVYRLESNAGEAV